LIAEIAVVAIPVRRGTAPDSASVAAVTVSLA
jgi:hypothetical protein